MGLQAVIVNNFWWKVAALVLAVISWFGFQPRDGRLIPQDDRRPALLWGSTTHTRYMLQHPITISKPATDTRQFKVTPSTVDITLSGEEKTLRALSSSEVRATVEINEFSAETNSVKIRLFVPPEGGIKLERLTPERVQVELLK